MRIFVKTNNMKKLFTKTSQLLKLIWRPFFLLLCYFSPTRITKIGEYKIKVARNWGYRLPIEDIVDKAIIVSIYEPSCIFFALTKTKIKDDTKGVFLDEFGLWGVLIKYGMNGVYISGELYTKTWYRFKVEVKNGYSCDFSDSKHALINDLQNQAL